MVLFTFSISNPEACIDELEVFETTGSLRIASSPEQLAEMRRGVSRARGIGMDVVATEVKRLGGGLYIESTPGQGARFILTLRRAPEGIGA